ncbi:MAG: alkaline phosphatase family protein [Candidatus Dormibacterales bacterium]
MLAAGTMGMLVGPSIGEGSGTQHPLTAGGARHIMLIVEENKNYQWVQGADNGIIGNHSAPYLNGLAAKYASATSWYSVTHGNQSYVALVSGSTKGGSIRQPSKRPNLGSELTSAGIPWEAYMEAMPVACDRVNDPKGASTSRALYFPFHNPFVYFQCPTQNEPAAGAGTRQLVSSLDSASPPDFVFVTPDMCDDMHTRCTGSLPNLRPSSGAGPDQVSDGDAWLAANLPGILSSAWFQDNGVVIVTWDEANAHGRNVDKSCWVNGKVGSNCGGGHIPTIVISAANASLSNHSFAAGGNTYGVLRGIEEAYGLPLLGRAVSSGNGDLSPAF